MGIESKQALISGLETCYSVSSKDSAIASITAMEIKH